jgi:methionyl-tRNA formyltransferase
MRVVFIGASRFGLRCLEEVARMDCCTVVGAVTVPRTFSISYRPDGVTNVLHADVAAACAVHGIDCAVMESGMGDPELLARVRAWAPDAFLVVGWYHMVPRAWRQLAPAFGMHASLLPDYSGGAPLVWAMINGEVRTGISLFQLADGVDDGPLAGQSGTQIADDDTIATLYARIEDLGVGLLRTHLPGLADGSAQLVPQDGSRRRVMPQRSPEDGVINWTWPAARVHDFIRAQTRPYPGAFSCAAGETVTLWASRKPLVGDAPRLAPAHLEMRADRLYVGCGEGTVLEILAVCAGGANASAAEWFARRMALDSTFRSFD